MGESFPDCWLPARISKVDSNTGNCQLDVRAKWITPDQRRKCLRPRKIPSVAQKDLMRSLLHNEGGAEKWAEGIFTKYCEREGGVRVLKQQRSGALGDEVERLLGVSGPKASIVRVYQNSGKTSMHEMTFQALMWEIISSAASEYTEKVERNFAQANLSGKRIEECYSFTDKVLGKGTFGEVRMARHVDTNMRRAVKLIAKTDGSAEELASIEQEIRWLKVVDHPFIVKLYEHYDDERYVYLVMDFCSGGDLASLVLTNSRNGHTFAPDYVAEVMRQLLCAINHMHTHSVVHLDLKANNIMMVPAKGHLTPWSDNATLCDQTVLRRPHVMVIDLGLAFFYKAGNRKYHVPRGTPMTMAPEVWDGDISPKADIFGLGCVMYMLVSQRYPFGELAQKRGTTEFQRFYAELPKVDWSEWNHMPEMSMTVCRKMLFFKKHDRPTAKQCLEHDFLMAARWACADTGGIDWIHADVMPPDLIRVLQQAPHRSVLYKSVAMGIACHWPSNQLPVIRDTFQQLDRKGSYNGRISRAQLAEQLMKSGSLTPEDASKCAQALDYNKDGSIDWTEFVAGCISLTGLEQELAYVFNQADRDHDGLLSRDDLAQLLCVDNNRGCLLRDIVVDLIQREDQNAKVDWHDFVKHFKTARDQRQRRATQEAVEEDSSEFFPVSIPPSEYSDDVEFYGDNFVGQAQAAVHRARGQFLEQVGAMEPGAYANVKMQLSRLREMGFQDQGLCVDALKRHGGCITPDLIEDLKRAENWGVRQQPQKGWFARVFGW